jgi:Sec-independent protein translocase protein TatA
MRHFRDELKGIKTEFEDEEQQDETPSVQQTQRPLPPADQTPDEKSDEQQPQRPLPPADRTPDEKTGR